MTESDQENMEAIRSAKSDVLQFLLAWLAKDMSAEHVKAIKVELGSRMSPEEIVH